MTVDIIKTATESDSTLQDVIRHVEQNDWYTKPVDETLKAYFHVKDELSISPEGILLRGTRIVIPETLQQQTIQLAHEGHQGITKCKALLREKVWFAAIDKKVEEVVSQCIYCAANTPQNHREPLQMSELPEAKWTNLAADFYGPLPTEYQQVKKADDQEVRRRDGADKAIIKATQIIETMQLNSQTMTILYPCQRSSSNSNRSRSMHRLQCLQCQRTLQTQDKNVTKLVVTDRDQTD